MGLYLKIHDYQDVVNKILEVSPNCIFIKDSRGRYRLASRALLRLYGLKKRSDIIGRTDSELAEKGIISNYEALRCNKEDQIVLSSKKSKTFPVNEFRSINGSTNIFQVIKTPFNSIKRRNNIIGISIDITQRKKVEKNLYQSEVSNKMLIESSPYGILVLNNEGFVVSYNNMLKTITGFTIEDIRDIRDITEKICQNENDVLIFKEMYDHIRRDFKHENKVIKLNTKKGYLKYASINLSLLPNDNTAIFLKDITSEVEVEKKIIDAKNHERRRIVTEIHDIMGHSLASLYMMTEATKDLIGVNNDKVRDLVSHASMQIQNSRLDLTMVLNTLENIDINDSFGFDNLVELLDFFEKLTGVKIDLDIADEIPKIILDKYIDNCFYRIIQEGLTNAVKHSKAAHIRVELIKIVDFFQLLIENDGEGCKEVVFGVGLRGISERAKKINGDLSVNCSDGHFSLTVKVPINGLEEAKSG